MIEKLKTLARMQKLDDEIGRCRELQKVLPEQLQALIQAVEQAKEHLQETQALKNEILKKQKELENEIKHNNDLKLKYGNQLSDIKTNKEYKALNSEIANLSQKNSELESQLLELMDTETEINKQLANCQKELKAAEQRKQDKEDDLKQQISQLDGKIEELRNRRTELARSLHSDALVKQYSNLLKNKNNRAVVYNVNGACGGCGFVIRPQIRIELDLRNKIYNCENCGRILMNKFDDEELQEFTPEEKEETDSAEQK
ncbi:MAG TPA: C4-type zinc ribbon domain-containing protein [Candidatus Cloacimonadota bacterium]|nr:C4-type zinc ribbon domain-containing protein [Candidatus Cloacimonadota bacterium]HOV16550.1 C4-type zinc ribbon domain-containing protein [Candidatus Cloacimonadota bacterium]HQL15130.1 C4-type zinc ribbon domain-containing protein [Candidatus Cloacimonadota bacterium]